MKIILRSKQKLIQKLAPRPIGEPPAKKLLIGPIESKSKQEVLMLGKSPIMGQNVTVLAQDASGKYVIQDRVLNKTPFLNLQIG